MTSPATIFLREKYHPDWRLKLARKILYPVLTQAMQLLRFEVVPQYPDRELYFEQLFLKPQPQDLFLYRRDYDQKSKFFGCVITVKDGGSGLVGQIEIQEYTVDGSGYSLTCAPKEGSPSVEIPFDISLGSDALAAGDDEVLLALVKALCP